MSEDSNNEEAKYQKAKYYEGLISGKEKTDESFDKNITYISAGALALSLTFIEKIAKQSNSKAIVCLIVAWGLLILTLLINLLGHYISSLYHNRALSELNEEDETKITKTANRNKRILTMTIISIATLIAGIGLLFIFVSLNI